MDLRERRAAYGPVAASAFIQRTGGGAREVVWTMSERWFCGCLMCLLVLILAGVITFGTLMVIDHADMQEDSSHINGVVSPVRCNDNNPCNIDFLRFEACQPLAAKNGIACNDSCFVGGAGECFAGECTGECPGNCVEDSDCPDIMDAFNAAFAKTCLNGGCTYRNFDAGETSVFSAASSGHLSEKLCEACIAANDPLRSCLEIVPFWLAVNPANNFDSILCIYAFRCNKYQNS